MSGCVKQASCCCPWSLGWNMEQEVLVEREKLKTQLETVQRDLAQVPGYLGIGTVFHLKILQMVSEHSCRLRCLSEWRSKPSTISRNGWSSTETTSLESTSPFFEEAFHGCQAQSREQSQRAAVGKTEVAGGGWWAWWPPPNDWYGNSEGWT